MAALEGSLPAAYDRDVDLDDPDADPQSESINMDDVEKAASRHDSSTDAAVQPAFDWAADPANPYNWPGRRKWAQVAAIASVGFLTSVGTSIISPATFAIRDAFGLHSTTVALLPFSFYVLALALGPVVGGPLSETVGRLPLLAAGTPLGLLFTVGSALCPTSSLAGLCILRFLAGFVLGPSLAIASGILTETFRPVERGLPSALFIVTPFLGPGMG
ncbi:major facilitator superfamily transporter multidrug resistance [Grosmannia clavigera kw1407]|uniref:Major facilitator superfamily transporter multidrug resistance n=1 Tax=Grosmannia clavigera (strain kw1407 / UAMH 11150) TaxID=655863 RepID=F0XUZ6_GROCL|nr:major facilitator superfamily transporter multidrug resistance [Grosmannia clavigera kw1407]EFW98683.1 major facilitator superfamily transporter multidrug resistance [Grosmannia clavigera kw1407]